MSAHDYRPHGSRPGATPTRGARGRALRLLPLLLVIAAACGPGLSTRPDIASRTSPLPPEAWADSVLGALSLRDRVAQLVWPFILGDYVPEGSAEWRRILALVEEEHVGGFIVSVGGPLDIAVKVNALQRASHLPLLMSADLETGTGFRARGGYFLPNAIELGGATNFPLQMALGASRDTALAYEFARVTARESRALGIHIAFGPVLDVNNNPANPVIGARSFSEDPTLAARLGTTYIRGLQEHGMIATGKHFPGHGDTETNSHLALSVVTASRARLDSVELAPFRAAIGAGVGAIMTFHGFLPALDSSGVPATLSPRVMTDLLRQELGFDGLLVTDAMDMAGVVAQFGPYEAAKRALAAGADVLLMPPDTRGTIDAVVAGIAEGRYTEERINASVRRILVLKAQFGLHRTRLVSIDSVRAIVGDSTHVALARTIAERGLVLAKDSLGLVPLALTPRPRLLSITYARRTELGAGVPFTTELRRGLGSVVTAYLNADEAAPNLAPVLALADSADVVVLGSYVNISSTTATAAVPPAFSELINGLRDRGRPVVLVSFGSPYQLQQAPDVSSYLIAWGGTAASQRAAARALLGEIPITGVLPMSIPPWLPMGGGERRAARVSTP
ncbi:MAG TPA: glycoside hydrolase family 3 protein [Gemmatimonadaceae bacterium]|nr:glycoside hydrolase family 3 protein [Gemmatimonadaceae bacterium]